MPARREGRAGAFVGLAGLAGHLGLFRAVAVPLWLALVRVAAVIRAGAPAGSVGGDLGFDVGQRVVGVVGQPGQVLGRQRDAVVEPVVVLGG